MDTFATISSKLHEALRAISHSEAPRLLAPPNTTATTPFECFFDVILQAVELQHVATEQVSTLGETTSTVVASQNAVGYQLVYEAGGGGGGGVLAFALVKDSLKVAAKEAEKCVHLLVSSVPTGSVVAVGAPYEVLKGTLLMLCMAPMRYTVWNMRKKALRDLLLLAHHNKAQKDARYISLLSELVTYELTFLNLVQSKWPKIPETWSHRQWVIRWMVSAMGDVAIGVFTVACLRAALSSGLCKTAILLSADRHPRNYPLWSGYMHPITSILVDNIPLSPESGSEGNPNVLVLDEWITLLESLLSSYGANHPSDVSFYTWITHAIETLYSKFPSYAGSLLCVAYHLHSLHTRQLLGVLATIDIREDMNVFVKKQNPSEKDDIVSKKSELNRRMVVEGNSRVARDGRHSLFQGTLVIRRCTLRALCSLVRLLQTHSLVTSSWMEEVIELELSLIGYMLQGALLPHRSADHPAMVADYNQFAVTELQLLQVTQNRIHIL